MQSKQRQLVFWGILNEMHLLRFIHAGDRNVSASVCVYGVCIGKCVCLVWPFPTGLGSDKAFRSELRGLCTTTHLLKLFDP